MQFSGFSSNGVQSLSNQAGVLFNSIRSNYTTEETALAQSLLTALRGFMPSIGASPHKGYNPKTNESHARPSRVFSLSVEGNTYSWDRVRPFVIEAKSRNVEFRLLLEEDKPSPSRFVRCIGELLEIYKNMIPLN